MKIRASINRENRVVAEVDGKGLLGAHLTLDDKQGSGAPVVTLRVKGFDTSDPRETRYLKWPDMSLEPGDQVELEVMPTADADAPTEVLSSLKDRSRIDASMEQADAILEMTSACTRKLEDALATLKPEMEEEAYKQLAFGVGSVLLELYTSIAQPIYRKHPDKVPEGLKDQPL